MITHRQIEAFLALMQSGTVVQAADRLCVTQPAISRLIREMEIEAGYALFQRIRGRLVPTQEAESLLEEVERFFVGLGHINDTAKAIGRTQVGRIRIVALSMFSGNYLPRIVTEVLADFPALGVRLDIQMRRQLLDAIVSNQYDAGFVTGPVDQREVRAERLAREQACCLVPPGSELAQNDVIDVGDLRDFTIIVPSREQDFGLRVHSYLKEHNATVQNTLEVANSETVRSLVANGAGVGIVTPFAICGVQDRRFVARRLRQPLTTEILLIYPGGTPLSRSTKLFRSLALEHASAWTKAAPWSVADL